MPKFPENTNFRLQSPLSKIESKANTLTNAEKAARLNKHAAKYHNDPEFRAAQVKYNQAALNDANQPSAKKSGTKKYSSSFKLTEKQKPLDKNNNNVIDGADLADIRSGAKRYSSSFKRTNKTEYISDYEFKTGKKPPVGSRQNAVVHEVNKKTTNNPVKTDPSGRYMTPNTNFTTKKKVDFTKGAPKKTTPKSKPIDFKNDKAPKTNYKTKFVDDSKSKVKTKVKTNGQDSKGGTASTPSSEYNKKGKNDSKATKVLDPKTGKAVNKKKKVTFKDAYKNRDMKTYGNLSFDEYKTEAKRQTKSKKTTKSYDAPKSQMKGTVTGPKTETKTTKTKKTTLKPDPKNFETVKSAKAKRKSAKKAVRTARKEFGRGSAEVKAAKTKRKEAKANVRSTKKRDKAASGKRSTIGKIGYFLAGPAGRAKMDAKKAAKSTTAKKEVKVDLTKKKGTGPRAKKEAPTKKYKK